MDETVDVPAGHLLAVEAGIEHEVEALEESAFLLTLAGLQGDGAAS